MIHNKKIEPQNNDIAPSSLPDRSKLSRRFYALLPDFVFIIAALVV